MTQTTAAVAMSIAKLEISTNNSTWTDISGEAQSLDAPEQARMSGEGYTLDGDTAIIKGGKREPIELVFSIVYTETDAEAYEVVRGQFETANGGDMYARWSPRGGSAGHEQVTTTLGVLTNFIYPMFDASTAGPIMAGFTLRVPSVSTAVISS